MAQYDLLLTQNTHVSGVEFTEKLVNIGKGDLLSGIATTKVPTVLAAGTNGYMLVRDDVEVTGLKWIAIQAGHTQGTDTGTTQSKWIINAGGYALEETAESASKFGMKVSGGATYADLQAKDATFNTVQVSTAPASGNYLTNKTYVDGLLAANNAMIFKGNSTVAALNALTTYNIGWTYGMTDAGSAMGQTVEIGDWMVALVARAGSGNVNADWTSVQVNADGIVIGPASTSDNYVALFNGPTGKLLKAGTGALGTAAYVATGTFATAAQGATADAAIPKATFTATGNEIILGSAASTYAPVALGASTFFGRKAAGNASAMTVAEAQALLTLGSAAYTAATAYATAAQGTTADGAVPKSLLTASDQMLVSTGVSTPASLAVAASTFVGRKASGSIAAMTVAEAKAVLAYGTAASNNTGDFATAAQGTLATNAIPKSNLNANSILYANTDATPLSLNIPEDRLLGRRTGETILALTPVAVINMLCTTAPATKTSNGWAGQIAFDANYFYRCLTGTGGAGTWMRSAMATNW